MSDSQRPRTALTSSRLLSAGIVAGGLALVGGSALAASPAPAPAAEPAPAPAPVRASDASDPVTALAPELDAFFAAGYTYDDAVALAARWGSADSFEAKASAGRELLAGEALPLAPGSAPAAPGSEAALDPARDAFWAAGHTYEEAVALAELWDVDSWEAKARAGQLLLDGAALPVLP